MGYRKVGYLEQLWYTIKWKIFHRRKCRGGIITKRPKPLGGRKLEREALREYGLRRKPGETDEQLRRRCMDKVENEYAGTPVVPQNILDEIIQQIAISAEVPREVLTGEYKEPNNPPPRPTNYLSGRDLDLYARDKDGLTRKPGETDEQLRRRCMAVEVERCYGGAELTINEGECENE